jgi:hypothetical protein
LSNAYTEAMSGLRAASDFFKANGSYLLGAGLLPGVEPLGALSNAELVTFAVRNAQLSADVQTGLAVETAQHISAITREVELGSQTKQMLYLDMASDYEDEALFYTQTASYASGVFKGFNSEGSQC